MTDKIIVSRNPVASLGYMLGRPSEDGSGHIGNIFREDDATLFAAAPAMLDALRKIRAEIMAWADDDNPDGAPSPNELAARIAVAARAAIVAADPAGEAASAARFLNHYDCPDCGTEWQDESAHVCDDRCPDCDASCSPSESEDILPGNAPCSASEQIPHHDKGEAPIASETPPEPEIDAIAGHREAIEEE